MKICFDLFDSYDMNHIEMSTFGEIKSVPSFFQKLLTLSKISIFLSISSLLLFYHQ